MPNPLSRLFRAVEAPRATSNDIDVPVRRDDTQRRFIDRILGRERTTSTRSHRLRMPWQKTKPVHFSEISKLHDDWLRHGGADRANRCREQTRRYLDTTATLPLTVKLQANRGIAEDRLRWLNNRRKFRPRVRSQPSPLAQLLRLLCCLPIPPRRARQRHAVGSRRV